MGECRPHSHFERGPHGIRFVSKAAAGTGSRLLSRQPARLGRRGRCSRCFGWRFGQGNPRTARTRTRRHDPPARARGQFGRRRRRSYRGDAYHHPPAHRRPDRAQQCGAVHGRHVLAGRRQVHPFGARHRIPGARRQQARRRGQRRRPRSQPQCRPPEGVLGGDRQCRQSDRADRAGKPRCWRSTPPSRRRGPEPPDAVSRSSPPRSRRWRCRPRTPPRKSRKRSTRCRRTPRGRSMRCTGSRKRSKRSGRFSRTSTAPSTEQTETTGEISDNAATASNFIAAVGESAAEIDQVTKQAEAHGESVASAGKAVTMFAQKLKARCAVLLRQDERKDQKEPAAAMQSGHGNSDRARPDRSAGLRNLHRRHPDRRTGRRKAAAERNPRCHAARYRRVQDPCQGTHQGRRPGPVRGGGCCAEGKDRRQAVVDPGRKHRIR